jgi:signal transduction histidine kinase
VAAFDDQLTRLRRLDDSLAACRCNAHIEAVGFASARLGEPESVRYVPASGRAPTDTAARMRQLREIADTTLPAQAAVLFGLPKDSSTSWLLVILPLYDRDGRATAFVALDADIAAARRRVFDDLFLSPSTVLPEELVGSRRQQCRPGANRGPVAQRWRAVSKRAAHRTGYRATVPVGRDGSMLVTLELSDAAANSILQGTLPSSGLSTTLILASLGAVLVVAIALAVRRAQSLARQRSDFAASVTHELRTPLTQILLNAETLHYRRVRSPAEHESTVSAIVRESRRLVYLLENVLHFSRAERAQLRLTRRPVRIDLFVVEHVDEMQSLLAGAGVPVTIDAALPANALADPDVLSLVLTNVIMNAVHHAPGSPIHLTVRTTGRRVELLADDHGSGIPLHERKRVQRAFVRLPPAVATHPSGSGLGLAVARDLMAAMGGAMMLEDAPGGGLRVRLQLDVAAAATQTVEATP